MKKLFSLIAIFFLLATAGGLWARGTANGTMLTNAKISGVLDPAIYTNSGELSASFSNAAHVIYFGNVATAPVTTKVTQGLDMSPVVVTTPFDISGPAGGSVVFTFYATNWGNGTQSMGAYITNMSQNGGSGVYTHSAGWTNSYAVALNNIWRASNFNFSAIGTNTPVGNNVRIDIRVRIPASMPNGATNQFYAWAFDWDGSYFPGDRWPGVGAILPSTVDTNTNRSIFPNGPQRDFQLQTFIVRAQALPVISLTKWVSTNRVKPYETLTYTIKYTNSGSVAALGLRIQDVLDASRFSQPTNMQINHNNGGWSAFLTAAKDGDNADSGVNGNKAGVAFTPNGGTIPVGTSGLVKFTVKVK